MNALRMAAIAAIGAVACVITWPVAPPQASAQMAVPATRQMQDTQNAAHKKARAKKTHPASGASAPMAMPASGAQ